MLITGAGGRIGLVLRRHLATRYRLRLLSRSPIDAPRDQAVHLADVADLRAIAPAFAGADAVIHLAAAVEVTSTWNEVLHANIVGTRNVFEAARAAGVGRVVFASSGHVMGMYEREGAPHVYDRGDPRVFDERLEPRPDSLYGVSKAFGETLGRYYADVHGLDVVCLRLGWVGPSDDPPGSHPRARAIWLSHRDCAQLFTRALETDVRYAVVYGISNNPRQFWDLRPARELLGYEPEDSAPA